LKKVLTPFRVGLLVLVSGVLLAVALAFVRKGGLGADESLDVHAYFRDASGLGPKSRVQIAGIPVGEISLIELEGTRAKVHLRIRQDVAVHTDAVLAKRSESLLGDYLLDLNPGTPQAPPMPDGGEIRSVVDGQGVEQLTATMSDIAGDVREVTRALRQVLGGEKGAASLETIVRNLEEASVSLNRTLGDSQAQLGSILRNVDRITSEVRALTEAQGAGDPGQLRRIMDNVEAVTQDTRALMAEVRGAAGQGGDGGVQEGLASVKQSLARLDRTLENVEEVTRKVRDGEGTVGKLLSDERLGQRLGETLEDVADFTDRITQTQLEVGLRSEYLFAQGGAKNFVTARLSPRPDKYYMVELVDDPRGETETVLVQNNPPAVGQPATQVQRVTRDSLKLTALAAKRFYFTTLRFGLIENTGGVGADLHFLDDRVSLHTDVFNFSVDSLRYPRLRSSLRVRAFDHLFATAGVDDALNRQVREQSTNQLLSGRDFFIGAGVSFTDDDLKSLLPILPTP
jgi:phospholipid/cholesterol/gamma-HCH transport system substrate-binding protein